MLVSSLIKILVFGSETGVTSAGYRPGQWYMEAIHLPDHMAILFSTLTKSKEVDVITFVDGLSVGVVKFVSVDSQLSSRLHSEFSLWIYFHSLFYVWIYPQDNGVLKSVFSFSYMDCLPFFVDIVFVIKKARISIFYIIFRLFLETLDHLTII